MEGARGLFLGGCLSTVPLRAETLVNVSFLTSLRFRMAAALVLVSTIPLAVAGFFAVQTAKRLVQEIVINQLENVAADKQELLHRWMDERKADLAVIAGSSVVQSFDPGQIAAYLRLVEGQYRVYNRFVVIGSGGRTVYESTGASERGDSEEACYRHAIAEGTYLSPVSWNDSRQEAVFHIAKAIRGPGDAPLGAVCATVGTQAILAQVLSVSLGETGECYLVDRSGTFLAHKQPQRILRESIAQSETFGNVFGEEKSGPIYTDYRGIPVLGASRAVPDTPWYLVVEQDRDEAFAGSYRLARHIAAAIAVTVLCAIGLSWLLASQVTSPIRALSEAAEAVSSGDFQRALGSSPLRRRDEIGTLDAAFRRMASQLWCRHAQLQRQIGTTEEELRRSEEKLESTLQAAARSERLAALGRLAAGVAHEIRTPLTSLKLFLQSLREETEFPPEQAEDFAVAMRQVQRMEATINLFLDFARPKEPCLAEVDFGKLVDDALVVVRPRANQQEVEIRRSIAGNLPKAEGDARQLGEALVNLMVNALEVMPHGGRLSIVVAPDPPEPPASGPRRIRIDVADTGPGIPESNLDRLFEPFFTTKASGSGLGLAIVQGIVERHGGTIAVRTRAGSGTTFSIALPAKNA